MKEEAASPEADVRSEDVPSAEPNADEPLINLPKLLDHLERFRWCFIKIIAAIVIAMVVCLGAGNWIVLILKWPLVRGAQQFGTSTPSVYLSTSTNTLRRLPMPSNSPWVSLLGKDQSVRLQMQPVTYKNNLVLGFVASPFKPGADGQSGEVALNIYGPMDGFLVAAQVAFFGGIILACPFVFYYLAQFALPLLGRGGAVVRRAVAPWVAISVGLFLGGIIFCYFALLPVSLYGSAGFARWLHFEANEWRAESYISFVCKFMIAMGIGFELPVLIILLSNIGLIDSRKLKKFRAYWIVLACVLSAILTPDGSPLTMLLMAAPLLVLYEVSLLIVQTKERRTAKALALNP